MNDPLRLVFWELTARCNLKCRHCRAEARPEAVTGELSTAEILRAADAIRAAGDPILILTGGEPLTRPDFLEIARACTARFSRVALATNGTGIDDAAARQIVASGIRRVSISLDGATPETHDAFRGVPGSFAAALNGYDALARAGASLQVNMTVARHNVGEVEPLLRMLLDRRTEAFHVFALVPVGCGAELGDNLRLNAAELESFLTWLAETALALGDRIHIKATCAPQYYRILRDLSRHTGAAAAPARTGRAHPGAAGGLHAVTRGCLAGSAVCFVSRTGDVQPCGYLPVKAGNLRERPFAEIWRDAPFFAALRDPGRLKGACGACGYRTTCGGCRARAYAVTGDWLDADPDCAYPHPAP